MMQSMERERAAYHEAGHVVMAMLQGVPVLAVRIAPSEAWTHLKDLEYDRLPPSKRALILCAGMAAEKLRYRDSFSWAGGYGLLDLLEVRRSSPELEVWAKAEAIRRIHEHWPAVEALAGALVSEESRVDFV